MATTGHYSGQTWHLTVLSDGTNRLTNDFTGSNKALDVDGTTLNGQMSDTNVDYSGQHWTLTKIVPI